MKNYELKDHLGNVRVVLGDKKTRTGTNAFAPEVVSYSNYYPFGMQMAGDVSTGNTYRYGYNGQEMDKDINTDGNLTTAEFWEYDARSARRWNRDPKPDVSISSYAAFAGNPTIFSDPKGDSSLMSNTGDVIHHNPKDKDLRVFMLDGKKSSQIGTLGGKIDLNVIFKNILNMNKQEAQKITGNWMSIWKQYADRVSTGEKWDYKGRTDNIIGLSASFDRINNTETEFSYGSENHLFSADIGNYHAGFVGKFLNNKQGIDDINLFMGAGIAEGAKNVLHNSTSEGLGRMVQAVVGRWLPSGTVFKYQFYSNPTLPNYFNAYGDVARDFIMNRKGMDDAKKEIGGIK